MKTSVFRSVIGAVALTALAVSGAHAQQKDSIKIGFVTFLSGPAAGPFGVPAKMAAEAIVESLIGRDISYTYVPGLIVGLGVVLWQARTKSPARPAATG